MRQIMFRLLASASTPFVFTPVAWAQERPSGDWYPCGHHMMSWSGGWPAMVFGPLFMILLLAALVAITVLLVRWLGGPWRGRGPHESHPGRTPLDILKERYARGEIDKEEFEERRRILGE